jgi:hypothetical protein
MPGITNATQVTFDSVQSIANSSTIPEFLVKINQIVFDGYFSFTMLWVTLIIVFVAANFVKDQPLNNWMYSSAFVSFLAIILRAVTHTIDGTTYALLSDFQFWMFPLMTVISVGIVWMTKQT